MASNMKIAHMGIVVFITGVLLSNRKKTQCTQIMRSGFEVRLGNKICCLRSIDQNIGPTFRSICGNLIIYQQPQTLLSNTVLNEIYKHIPFLKSLSDKKRTEIQKGQFSFENSLDVGARNRAFDTEGGLVFKDKNNNGGYESAMWLRRTRSDDPVDSRLGALAGEQTSPGQRRAISREQSSYPRPLCWDNPEERAISGDDSGLVPSTLNSPNPQLSGRRPGDDSHPAIVPAYSPRAFSAHSGLSSTPPGTEFAGGLSTPGAFAPAYRPFIMFPEKRFYLSNQEVSTTKVAIHTNLLSDIYMLIGAGNSESGWFVTIMQLPYIFCIWLGFLLAAIAGLKSLQMLLKQQRLIWL